jgi:hypothetical protein
MIYLQIILDMALNDGAAIASAAIFHSALAT